MAGRLGSLLLLCPLGTCPLDSLVSLLTPLVLLSSFLLERGRLVEFIGFRKDRFYNISVFWHKAESN